MLDFFHGPKPTDPRDLFIAAAIVGLCVNGHPEDTKHNAIVAVRLADEVMKVRAGK